MIYGYARVSTDRQKVDRQIKNILKEFPEARIFQEKYTGSRIDGRKELNKLIKIVKAGDTIVFDSVSRMSRNADDGVKLYFDLFDRGVKLVFIKEHYLDTEIFEQNIADKIPYTGTDLDLIIKGFNNYLKKLAEKQIRLTFSSLEKELSDLSQTTKEGIEIARASGKQIGQKQGQKLNVKKKEPIKKIMKKSRDFNGTINDTDLMKILGIARNTYYKYKKELANDLKEQVTN